MTIILCLTVFLAAAAVVVIIGACKAGSDWDDASERILKEMMNDGDKN